MGETKWDVLYDPKKKSLFSRIEEFAINTYFSDAFVKAILSASKIKSGKIFEPGSGGGMACAKFAQKGFEIISMDLSENALKKGERVELRDIFTLETKIQKARLSKNPKTNEEVKVPEKKTVQFKMSKKWFNNINNE